MTKEKIAEALGSCLEILEQHPIQARRCNPEIKNPTRTEQLEHALWLCAEALMLLQRDQDEKAMRWLCFIQGVLWANHDASIETFKNMNKPDVP